MFRDAYKEAAEFTLPVVVSRLSVGGQCVSSIAACVVINEEGWIVTAAHVLDAYKRLLEGARATEKAEAAIKAIKEDGSLSAKERRKKLAAYNVKTSDTKKCSAWFGGKACNLARFNSIPAIDLAIGKLEPWEPDWVKAYPVFKDPTKDLDYGTSLCKLGFPFHHFKPSWDDAKQSFKLPPEALPIPRFPIEGIFTRTADLIVQGAPPTPFPLRWLETSTPGLKGQSGGPTFDVHGTVWAIQSKVITIPLGFDGTNTKNKDKVPQFLSVGLGVHPDTIFGLFKQQGINFKVSTY